MRDAPQDSWLVVRLRRWDHPLLAVRCRAAPRRAPVDSQDQGAAVGAPGTAMGWSVVRVRGWTQGAVMGEGWFLEGHIIGETCGGFS